MSKEPEKVYLVVTQIEGTVQEPIPFFVYKSAVRKADGIAGELDRRTDDVRVFELDLAKPLRASTVYVPQMDSRG